MNIHLHEMLYNYVKNINKKKKRITYHAQTQKNGFSVWTPFWNCCKYRKCTLRQMVFYGTGSDIYGANREMKLRDEKYLALMQTQFKKKIFYVPHRDAGLRRLKKKFWI